MDAAEPLEHRAEEVGVGVGEVGAPGRGETVRQPVPARRAEPRLTMEP